MKFNHGGTNQVSMKCSSMTYPINGDEIYLMIVASIRLEHVANLIEWADVAV